MTIMKPVGPSGGAAVVGRAVSDLMARGPNAFSPRGGAAGMQATQPIRLFMLKSSDIKDASFLKEATPIGWRYLILGQGPAAVADVSETSGLRQPDFGSLIRGPIAERLGQAAELAEHKYEADPSTFEARILEIPSLYITALWLHGPRDIFFPFLEGAQKDAAEVHEDPSFVSRVLGIATTKRQAPRTPEKSR